MRKIDRQGVCRVALLAAFVFLPCLVACKRTQTKDHRVVIFAAASLTDALHAINSAARDSLPDTELLFNFAGSSILARQTIAGSPADIFFSANPEWMQELVKRQLVDSHHVQDVLSNRLVVVVPKNSTLAIHSLRDLEQHEVAFIAVADPAHVPAGRYAKQTLAKAGIWKNVIDKLVSAQDVRAALSFVEAGEADAGIVYYSDTRVSKRVKIAFDIPDSLQPDIRYQAALLKTAAPAAAHVLGQLTSPVAAQIFKQGGFIFLGKNNTSQ